MTFTVITMVIIMGTVVWWVVRQTVNVEPWLAEESTAHIDDVGFVNDENGLREPSMKIGLGVFLAVATALFALFISAYFIRMEMNDWRPLAEPMILWANTIILVLSSACLQWAVIAGRRQDMQTLRKGMLGAGVFALAFLIGQLMAWNQLVEAGYYLTSNPANAFFYVLTGFHGLHLLGGLYAWAVTLFRSWSTQDESRVYIVVNLCAAYWHFLLVIWLVLFALMSST